MGLRSPLRPGAYHLAGNGIGEGLDGILALPLEAAQRSHDLLHVVKAGDVQRGEHVHRQQQQLRAVEVVHLKARPVYSQSVSQSVSQLDIGSTPCCQ